MTARSIAPMPVCLHRLDMLRIVADGEQAAMHRRMQRLDAAVHDFRKAGDIRDIRHRKAGVGQRLVRAAGRKQPHALSGKRPGEVDDAGLVGHGRAVRTATRSGAGIFLEMTAMGCSVLTARGGPDGHAPR